MRGAETHPSFLADKKGDSCKKGGGMRGAETMLYSVRCIAKKSCKNGGGMRGVETTLADTLPSKGIQPCKKGGGMRGAETTGEQKQPPVEEDLARRAEG